MVRLLLAPFSKKRQDDNYDADYFGCDFQCSKQSVFCFIVIHVFYRARWPELYGCWLIGWFGS